MSTKIQFELFKRFYGVILTPTNVDQAAQYSPAAGCGGPGYPVFCETTSESREMERTAKGLARRYNAGFEVINQIKRDAKWWEYSRGSKKIKTLILGWKRYKYGVKKEPALVIIKGKENIVIYSCEGMESRISDFLNEN
jgi:hypothetical protein